MAAIHGDGLTEPRCGPRCSTAPINHPVTAAVYRRLHPELGPPLVDRSARIWATTRRPSQAGGRAAARQREWAERLLADEPEMGLVIMGHTHRARWSSSPPGRHYLNPGAWFDGFRYAIATERGAELHRFTPSAPLPPAPAARR